MIKNFKKLIKVTSVLIGGSLFLYNCESDPDSLGAQLFTENAAQENVTSYDVTAYNINNNDSLRSDAAVLNFAQLGAFSENVFGSQKASYVSQVRLQEYNPSFGLNPIVDSVVLEMKMPATTYAADSVTTTSASYTYPEGAVAATKEIKKYPVSKYGKTKINEKTLLNINVHEVTDFLQGASEVYYSNATVNYGSLIGSKVFDGKVQSVKITKTSDNASLFSTEPGIRIPLDATFFQNKIINKAGSQDLKDAYNFIRYFRGLRLSVAETDGYLFPFSPANLSVIIYYKKDVTTGGSTTKQPSTFVLPMGSPQDVHIGQYAYNRTNTALANALSNTDTTNGDKKLFLQGMGGPSIGFRVPPATIALLKNKLQNEKIGIISAKVRMYTDKALWDNNYQKPGNFIFLEKDAKVFLAESSALFGAPGFFLVRPYDLDKNLAYYDFTITTTLKDIVEKETANKDFIIKMGSFLTDTNNLPLGYNVTSRAYTPNRLVFVGTDASNAQRIQLNVIYGSKN